MREAVDLHGAPTPQGKRPAGSGDVVDIKNDEWQWHGATQDHFMAHQSRSEGDTESGDHAQRGG